MKYGSKNRSGFLAKKNSGLKNKTVAIALVSALSCSVAVTANAGILGDVGNAVGGVIDKAGGLFSSATKVAKNLAGKVDRSGIPDAVGRCSIIKASKGSDTTTDTVLNDCGVSTTELSVVFKKAGGSIAKQSEQVARQLKDIPENTWNDVSGALTQATREVVIHYGDQVTDRAVDLSENLLGLMKNAKSTLLGKEFSAKKLGSSSSLNVYYTKAMGKLTFDMIINGTVKNNISYGGANFVGVDGKLIAKLKTTSAVGYNPQAYSQLEYVNPIIKVQDNHITGLLVLQPEGSIVLTAAFYPFQLSLGLEDMIKTVPSLKKISALNKVSKAFSFDADVASVSLKTPLTNQEGAKLSFEAEISAGVDGIAKISNGWRVKVVERVGWTRNITINAPALQMPLSAVPAGVLGKLESNPKSSYSEQIVSYTFDDASSNIIEDKSGHGNHARKVGGVNIQSGAAFLNGSNGYIDLPDDVLRHVDEVTVYAEVNISDKQKSPYFIYGLGNTKGDRGDGYLFTTGNNYRSVLSTCHWICEQSTSAEKVNVPRGSWQKLVYTVKGKVATLYLNGDIISQKKDMSLKPSDIGNGRTVANYIGRPLYKGDHYFHGAIRNFQIWNGAMNHEEVAAKFGNKNTITVRAKGTAGGELIGVKIGKSTLKTFKLTRRTQNFTVTTAAKGELFITYLNDSKTRDAKIDYVQVNDKIYQAEKQKTNTAVYANGKCGGKGYSEWMQCNGYISFGNILK